ncbi:MAG TPA: hypothetical protein VF412_15985 [Bdellovibrio sp.]|uniref:hypothetical protein n=1 Tax=Bdellovibrio sp. TaxID=28201 RepID=UPI002EFBC957
MFQKTIGHFCLLLSLLFFVGCSDATPHVSALRALDQFEFKTTNVVSADLSVVPLQATCSKFISSVDVSFDGGTTWQASTSYDSASQPCSTAGNYTLTLSNSKSPWSSETFTNGQNISVKFRAFSRAGYYVYREVIVKYTPSATIRQEVLAGMGSSSNGSVKLKGRLRAQRQVSSSGSGYILKGRIAE